ncbi:uncharacterized protein [Spinacia oleracea]|uniref:CCHC-type domain-containing protein n=1 Tax=Spinacia oleracea TaxID=3562 RepID=A0A9R0ICN2_SPIOL|nr:uncharacterized protein LOC110786478 [Spinacia oleracea]
MSDDDLVPEDEQDGELCPTILLSKEEKARLRRPWLNALIIKLFDKRLSYAVLIRRLRLKWNLKGAIALTDVGCAYYVVRFSSLEDYDFVLTQGPWMIGESYLSIRKWVSNFVPDESPIKTLTAWVRIPNLSVEYFDRQFLQRIGEKIGRVVRIDKNTESVDRGQYIRFCIEVDLTKPLLAKFRLNGRIWKIQYEGLRLICFKCGHLGHKYSDCTMFRSPPEQQMVSANNGEGSVAVSKEVDTRRKPEEADQYGSWMLVQKTTRKYNTRPRNGANKQAQQQQETRVPVSKTTQSANDRTNQGHAQQQETGRNDQLNGSRFAILDQGDNIVSEGEHERNATMVQVESNSGQASLGIPINLGEDGINGEIEGRGDRDEHVVASPGIILPTVDLGSTGQSIPIDRRSYNN